MSKLNNNSQNTEVSTHFNEMEDNQAGENAGSLKKKKNCINRFCKRCSDWFYNFSSCSP